MALIGRPNVGKSTLLNAYVGDKVAITSPRPQTTRRRILGIRTTSTEQAMFVDTPGIHRPTTDLGRHMVDEARRAIPDADIVVFVVDVSKPPNDEDRAIAGIIRKAGRPTLVAMNKCDLLAPDDIEAHVDAFLALVPADDWTLTIATEGHNLERLWAMVAERLPTGPFFYPEDQITDQTDRMLAAELIREAALRYLQQEVPHGIEVVVEGWVRQDNGRVHIDAQVIVEREAHKGIVIGKGGSMIKRIGRAARREIEAMIAAPVFLALRVRVRPGWRKRAAEVRRLGYG